MPNHKMNLTITSMFEKMSKVDELLIPQEILRSRLDILFLKWTDIRKGSIDSKIFSNENFESDLLVGFISNITDVDMIPQKSKSNELIKELNKIFGDQNKNPKEIESQKYLQADEYYYNWGWEWLQKLPKISILEFLLVIQSYYKEEELDFINTISPISTAELKFPRHVAEWVLGATLKAHIEKKERHNKRYEQPDENNVGIQVPQSIPINSQLNISHTQYSVAKRVGIIIGATLVFSLITLGCLLLGIISAGAAVPIGIAVVSIGLAGIGGIFALAPTNDATPRSTDTFIPSNGTKALRTTLPLVGDEKAATPVEKLNTSFPKTTAPLYSENRANDNQEAIYEHGSFLSLASS